MAGLKNHELRYPWVKRPMGKKEKIQVVSDDFEKTGLSYMNFYTLAKNI
jgi:hypothetical protein